MKANESWKYPLFISYSRDDEVVTQYPSTLKAFFDARLPARLRTTPGLGHLDNRVVFFDSTGVPATGSLTQALDDAIAQSFALMIIVDNGYVSSKWCLRELQQFQRRFAAQPEELSRRLFIIVTNKEAEESLLKHPLWPKKLMIESIRSQFYEGAEPMDLTVLTTPPPGEKPKAVPNPDFVAKGDHLLKRLVDLIGADPDSVPDSPGPNPIRPKRILVGRILKANYQFVGYKKAELASAEEEIDVQRVIQACKDAHQTKLRSEALSFPEVARRVAEFYTASTEDVERRLISAAVLQLSRALRKVDQGA